jgi:hypothetical protein
MMTFDDDRKRAFERKFALDQELAFKVAARRNALLGRWAAARIGLHDVAAEAYVATLIENDIVHIDPQAVVRRVLDDLLARGTPISREELDAVVTRLTARARAEIVRGALR